MRRKKIRFFTIADYEEEENWLREMHNAGWKLVKMTPPCFYTFESCEPQDVIYRLDFKSAGQSAEYMQMVKDFGWEYFEQCMGWLYFRKPADSVESKEEGELFSDHESKADMVEHIVKRRLLPILGIFLCCVIPNFLNAVNGRMSGFSEFFAVFFGIMFVIYMYLIIYCGLKLRKIRSRYRH